MKKSCSTEKRLIFADLFCGPGRFDDKTESTPLLVLKEAAKNEDLLHNLQFIFNDKDSVAIEKLKQEFDHLDKSLTPRIPPIFLNQETDDKLIRVIEKLPRCPTLSFVDPCGYKGLTTHLFRTLIKNFGCDCVFFFNYSRINRLLPNPTLPDHPVNLFGKEVAEKLQEKIHGLKPREREEAILQSIRENCISARSKLLLALSCPKYFS